MTVPGEGASDGVIEIARRNFIVDLMRRYLVFIDDAPVGQLWAHQTGSYRVRPGQHVLRLCIQGGTADSGNVVVDVAPGSVRRLRIVGKGLGAVTRMPGLMVQQAANPGSAPGDRPWIVLRQDS